MAKRKAAAKKGVLKEKTEDVAKNGSESDSVVQKVEEKEPENNVNESETSEDDTKVEVPVRAKGKTGRGRQAKGVSKATPKAVKKGNKRGKITTSVPSPAKKAKPEPVPEKSEAEDDKDYEVGKILGVRFPKIGKREFSIQWKGYSVKEATWEPEENLDCEDLVKEFMAKHEESKTKIAPDLRVNRKQTQPYMDSNRNKGVRSSRRFTSKPRATYHGQDE